MPAAIGLADTSRVSTLPAEMHRKFKSLEDLRKREGGLEVHLTSDRRNAGDQTRHAGQSQLLGVDRAGRAGVGIAPGVRALQATITLDGVGDKAIAKYQRAIATPGIDTLAIDPDMLLLVDPDGGHRATRWGGPSPAGKCW